jgi:hypothetical protein
MLISPLCDNAFEPCNEVCLVEQPTGSAISPALIASVNGSEDIGPKMFLSTSA